MALTLAGPLPWVELAFHPPLVVLLPGMALAGVGLGALGPFYLILQYERVPRDDQAPLFGLTFGLQTAGEGLGAALAGLSLTYLTLQQTLLAMSLITTTLVLFAVPAPSLKILQDRNVNATNDLDHSDADSPNLQTLEATQSSRAPDGRSAAGG